jgi:hypothetical protein
MLLATHLLFIASAFAGECDEQVGKAQLQCFAVHHAEVHEAVEAACAAKEGPDKRACRVRQYGAAGLEFNPAPKAGGTGGGGQAGAAVASALASVAITTGATLAAQSGGGRSADPGQVARVVAISGAITAVSQILIHTPNRCPKNPKCRLSSTDQQLFAQMGFDLAAVVPEVTQIANSRKPREQQRQEIALALSRVLASEALVLALNRASPETKQSLYEILEPLEAALQAL